METIEHFSEFLKKIGVHLLTLGIVLVVIWLLISGLIRGLRKKNDKDSGKGGEGQD